MKSLVMLELRRQRPIVLRMIVLTVVVGIVFFAAGKRTPSAFLAALLGSSIGVSLIVPMGIARDKLEGTLDFICSLPVEPGDIAASRLAVMALVSVPWAAGVGALSLGALPAGAPGPFSVALAAWLTMTLLGACATALFALYDFEQLLGAPMVALVIVTVLFPRALHALFPGLDPGAARRLMASPYASLLLTLVLMATCIVVGFGAFILTRSGLASYDPNSNGR